jgi:peptidoglycan/LPS O-acetylase OafA/YrhL
MIEHPIAKQVRYHFLDGIRGWMSLTVCLTHALIDHVPIKETLTKCFFLNGDFAVRIFFITSGYALVSGYMVNGSKLKLLAQLYGRYFRLAIPVLAACFLIFLFAKVGVATVASPPRSPQFAQVLGSTSGTFKHALIDVFFANDDEVRKTLLLPLWTMRVELIGSMIVFLLCTIVGSTQWRWLVYGVSFVLGLVPPRAYHDLLSFVFGMAVADINLRSAGRRIVGERENAWALAVLLCGIVFATQAHTDETLFLLSFMFAFVGVVFSQCVKRFLEFRLSQFLGKLSFSLYLTHFALLIGPAGMFGEYLERRGILVSYSSKILYSVAEVFMALALSLLFLPVDRMAVWASRRIGTALAGYHVYILEALSDFVRGARKRAVPTQG